MFRSLWKYIKNKKYIYVMIIIALFVDFGLSILPTRIIQHIVDEISMKTLTHSELLLYIVVLIVSAITVYGSSFFWNNTLFKEADTFGHQLRVKLFAKLVGMRTPFYHKFRSGDMLTRFTSDIRSLTDLIGYGLMSILMSIATLVFVIPTMLWMNWLITTLSLIPLITFGILFHFLGKRQEMLVSESRDAVASLSDEVLEVVEGVRVMRAYSQKEAAKSQFQQKTAKLREKSNRIIRLQGAYGRIANVMLALSTIIVLGLGGYYLNHGLISLGQIVALQLFLFMLLDPIWILSDIMLVYQMAKVSFNKIEELLQTDDDMTEDGTEVLQSAEEITFDDYNFTYDKSDKLVLENINLTLRKGQTLGVVGKTGSGKTTFVRQLLMQYPIGSGKLLINQKPLQDYQRNSIEKLVAYVPQEHTLFSRSVYENLLIGKSDADMIEIAAAIESAAFTEDLERMEQGIDTLIGEKGVSISGGQKQRISMSRAFIKDAEILILDDSLSAVDAKTERRIIDNIQAIRQQKTTIIVTHRLSSVSHADWIIVLENGKISEEGTPDMLIAQRGWYFEQYERQQLEGGE
ncbi:MULTISPECIES: ABC transporter ATP-binding protein [unclassified Granulicatella]|uniref:ABC transporter ATP-binding protein n=1 Tax=unclassified Granulicatella TaxID=2630493 RepID=UPI0010739A53|nr:MULTISPECIES: ABC transporter ATP-binding protein [unclassified Granulicatella]MBF0779785.1 ABC transporter ATP-binding protein [Granulicatella sp. 19428wC4_WM01]TFU96187.1 ABC transporter ATP-binding protein [Granulicatella sp. WM01]